jgi:hypothetical protein
MRGLKRKKLIVCFNKEVKQKKKGEVAPEHTWPLKACSAAPFLKARMRGLKRKKLIVCFNKEVKKKNSRYPLPTRADVAAMSQPGDAV